MRAPFRGRSRHGPVGGTVGLSQLRLEQGTKTGIGARNAPLDGPHRLAGGGGNLRVAQVGKGLQEERLPLRRGQQRHRPADPQGQVSPNRLFGGAGGGVPGLVQSVIQGHFPGRPAPGMHPPGVGGDGEDPRGECPLVGETAARERSPELDGDFLGQVFGQGRVSAQPEQVAEGGARIASGYGLPSGGVAALQGEKEVPIEFRHGGRPRRLLDRECGCGRGGWRCRRNLMPKRTGYTHGALRERPCSF